MRNFNFAVAGGSLQNALMNAGVKTSEVINKENENAFRVASRKLVSNPTASDIAEYQRLRKLVSPSFLRRF